MSKIRCKKCGTVLISKDRHDFQSCECGVAVDGGGEYCKLSYPDGKSEDWIEHLPLTWGTLDGQQLRMHDIDDDHLVNIIHHMEEMYASFLKIAETAIGFDLGGGDPSVIYNGGGALGWKDMTNEAKKRGLKWKKC